MKLLVDTSANTIDGVYQAPLDFSISSKYVVDVPDNLGVSVTSNVIATSITAKKTAYTALFPTYSLVTGDEFLDVSKIDTSLSTGILAGPNKRTSILAAGKLITQAFTISVGLTSLVPHWYAFLLYRNTGSNSVAKPAPSDMLYNYDSTVPGFSDFVTTNFTVDLMDSIGTSVLAAGLLADVANSFSHSTPFNARLRFTNTTSKIWHISDWILLAK